MFPWSAWGTTPVGIIASARSTISNLFPRISISGTTRVFAANSIPQRSKEKNSKAADSKFFVVTARSAIVAKRRSLTPIPQ